MILFNLLPIHRNIIILNGTLPPIQISINHLNVVVVNANWSEQHSSYQSYGMVAAVLLLTCCSVVLSYHYISPQQQSSGGHIPHIGERLCGYCVCDEGTICNKTINRKWITAAETLEGSRSIRACCRRRHRIGFSWSSF